MRLDELAGRLRDAAANPPMPPKIRAVNPGGRRTRQTAISQKQAIDGAVNQIAGEARKKITG